MVEVWDTKGQLRFCVRIYTGKRLGCDADKEPSSSINLHASVYLSQKLSGDNQGGNNSSAVAVHHVTGNALLYLNGKTCPTPEMESVVET